MQAFLGATICTQTYGQTKMYNRGQRQNKTHLDHIAKRFVTNAVLYNHMPPLSKNIDKINLTIKNFFCKKRTLGYIPIFMNTFFLHELVKFPADIFVAFTRHVVALRLAVSPVEFNLYFQGYFTLLMSELSRIHRFTLKGEKFSKNEAFCNN